LYHIIPIDPKSGIHSELDIEIFVLNKNKSLAQCIVDIHNISIERSSTLTTAYPSQQHNHHIDTSFTNNNNAISLHLVQQLRIFRIDNNNSSLQQHFLSSSLYNNCITNQINNIDHHPSTKRQQQQASTLYNYNNMSTTSSAITVTVHNDSNIYHCHLLYKQQYKNLNNDEENHE
jgi:hypothetical protein